MSHGLTSALALLVSGSLVTGCWTETQTVHKTTVSSGSREVPRGSPSVSVVLATDDNGTRAEVSIVRTCQRVTTVRERTVLKREKSGTAVGYIASGALIGLGVLALRSRGGDASQVQGVAGLAILSGAGVLAVVAGRAGTTETPVGAEEREVDEGTVACGRKPAAGVRVAVRSERGELTGDTSADGVAHLEGNLDELGEVKVLVDEQPVQRVERRKGAAPPSPPPRAPTQPPPRPPPEQPAAPLPPPPPRPEGASG